MTNAKTENLFLKNIHLKILILSGILVPSITGSAAYFGLIAKIEQKDRLISDRVSSLELSDNKTFIDRASFNDLSDRVDTLNDHVNEMLGLLKARRGR